MLEAHPSAQGHISIAQLRDVILPILKEKLGQSKTPMMQRGDVAREAKVVVAEYLSSRSIELNLLDQRDLVTSLTNGYLSGVSPSPVVTATNDVPQTAGSAPAAPAAERLSGSDATVRNPSRNSVDLAKVKLQPLVLERIDTSVAAKMKRESLGADLRGLVSE